MTEILIFIATFIAAAAGTITGFGTSTILVPALLLFYPLPEVLLFVGVIHWFGNIWKMYFFRQGRSLALLLSFGLMGAVGSFLGARFTLSMPQDLLQQLLGVFFVFYGFFAYWKPELKLKQSFVSISIGGLLSGVSSGIFGVGGAIRGVFLTAFGLKKAVYLFTAGAIGFMIDSTRIITYWQQGYTLSSLHPSWLLVAIPVSLFGAWCAKRLVDKLPEKLFQQVVLIGLAAFGVYSILKNIP